MAIFNPDVPDDQARYLDLSRPISTPDFKSSKASLIKDAGNIFAGGISAADTIIKAFGEAETRAAMERERDDYAQALDAGKQYAQMATTNVATATDGTVPVGQSRDTTAMNLLPDPSTLPQDLKQLPNTIGVFSSARANGKLSPTDFYARTTSVLKDIRSKYPIGYRDYIDKVASDVLGVNPANAYVSSVLGDINSYLASGQAERNHLLRLVESHSKYPGAANAYDKVASGEWNGAALVRHWLGPQAQIDLGFQRRKAAREDIKGARDIVKQDWEDDLNIMAAAKAIEPMRALHNYDKVPEGYRPTGPEAQLYLEKARQAKANYMAEMTKYISTPDNNGNTHAKILDRGPANKIIEENARYFDFSMEQVTNDKWGVAKAAERMLTFIKDEDKLDLVRDKNIGIIIRKLNAIEGLAPNITKDFFKRTLEKELPERLDTYSKLQKLDILAPNDPANPPSFLEKFKQAKSDGIELPKYFDGLVSMIDSKVDHSLLNPKTPDPIKERIAISAFNTNNLDFISSLVPESRDANGRVKPGRLSVYQRWTNQDVAGEMYRLGQAKPELWTAYRNWVAHTTNELFKTDIKDLTSKITRVPNETQITWDDVNHRFGINYKNIPNLNLKDITPIDNTVSRGTVATRSGSINVDVISLARTINKINVAMSAVSNVGKVDQGATDANAYALNILMQSGMDLSKVDGLPRAILNAMRAFKEQQEELEAAKKKFK